jgi:L-lactate dehydrogenase complex protein LldE
VKRQPPELEKTLKVGLFIPCYVDQFYPEVGLATLDVLQQCGIEVVYPQQQTCCGQPMANTGCLDAARPLVERFISTFASFDYVVAPSGSCVAMVRHHFHQIVEESSQLANIKAKTYELCEFLTDVLHVSHWQGQFPYRVGLHQACHGLRELRLGQPSEVVGPAFGKIGQLLAKLGKINFVELKRTDECCGFGGTFAVSEEAVSVQMGRDRLSDHVATAAEVIVSADMSCIMHLRGLASRQQVPMRFLHVAQLLAAAGGGPRFEAG